MQLADIWAKMANQSRLTSEEMAFLRRAGNETQMRNSFVAGNTTADNRLAVNFPFMPIFSEVFTIDTAQFSVTVPQGYKHLIVICNGRSAYVGTGAPPLFARFNDDANSNYGWQTFYGSSTTATAAQNLSNTAALIGSIGGNGNPANETASAFGIILNYTSSFFKQILYIEGRVGASASYAGTASSSWRSTQAIQKMTVFADENIKVGTVVSIYGIT